MYNKKIRNAIANYCQDNGLEGKECPALFGPSDAYDNAIIGISASGAVVYDYEKIVEEVMNDDGISYDEAVDWVDYNVMRSLGYNLCGIDPIVITTSVEDLCEKYDYESEEEGKGVIK